ncbi:MAG: hypothetical protein M1839_007263 [Geoglossum umbratile]|nr:MAG: hypothetical protein M1839_007263 [Geoglossum umbratile]
MALAETLLCAVGSSHVFGRGARATCAVLWKVRTAQCGWLEAEGDGFTYSVTRTVDGHTYQLSLTDTAGQEEYRGLWASSNLKSDAFLLVYDITNADSLDALNHFIGLIDIEADARADEGGGGLPPPVKIVAGNKCDLAGNRQVRSQTGLEWARRNGCGFMETSARNVVNIEETFALLVRRVVEQRRLHAIRTANPHQYQNHTATNTTQPLTPLEKQEKSGLGSVDLEDRPGSRKARWWARLKCW